jgi:hypothetical protein
MSAADGLQTFVPEDKEELLPETIEQQATTQRRLEQEAQFWRSRGNMLHVPTAWKALATALRTHRRPMTWPEKPICALSVLIMLSSSAMLVLDEVDTKSHAVSWQQCAIMANTIGFAWSVLLVVAVCLIGVYDEHEPCFVAISSVVTWALLFFTLPGMMFVTMQDYGDRGWPHGTPNPRYFSNYGILGICWGFTLISPIDTCAFSQIFSSLRSDNSSAIQKAAKATLPKLGYAIVYLLITAWSVLFRLTADNLAAQFAEACAQANLLTVALFTFGIGFLFHFRKANSLSLVLQGRLTKLETLNVVSVLVWGLLVAFQLLDTGSLLPSELMRIAFGVTFLLMIALIMTIPARRAQRLKERNRGSLVLVSRTDKEHQLVFESSEDGTLVLTPAKALMLGEEFGWRELNILSPKAETVVIGPGNPGMMLKLANLPAVPTAQTAANPPNVNAPKQLQLVYSAKDFAIKMLGDGDETVLHCDRSKHGYEGNLVYSCRKLKQASDEYTKTEEERRKQQETQEATQKFVLNPEDTLSPAADDTVVVGWVPDKYTVETKERLEKRMAVFDEEAGWEMETEAPVAARGVGTRVAPVAGGEVQDALESPA